MDNILKEYKTTILNTLAEKLSRVTNTKIELRNGACKTCMEASKGLVTSIFENYKPILRQMEIRSRNDVVMLQGEIDFNEYSEVASKLTECGFKKHSVGEYNGKLYDSYRNKSNFVVVIPKSKA